MHITRKTYPRAIDDIPDEIPPSNSDITRPTPHETYRLEHTKTYGQVDPCIRTTGAEPHPEYLLTPCRRSIPTSASASCRSRCVASIWQFVPLDHQRITGYSYVYQIPSSRGDIGYARGHRLPKNISLLGAPRTRGYRRITPVLATPPPLTPRGRSNPQVLPRSSRVILGARCCVHTVRSAALRNFKSLTIQFTLHAHAPDPCKSSLGDAIVHA